MRDLWIPLYLLACLILGGASNGGFFANGVLQVLGAILIAWALWQPSSPQTADGRIFARLLIAAVLMILLQFVPIPQALWDMPTGRAALAAEGAAIGLDYAPVFWGLLPNEALKSAVWLIPAMALAVGMLRLSAWQPQRLAWAIVAAMALSVLLGAIQLGQGRGSLAYLYTITNVGSTVGFFANSNHLATLMLVSLPFIAALIARQFKTGKEEFNVLFIAIGLGLAALVITGIVVNGSLAGFALIGPVLVASAMILVRSWQIRKASLILLPLVLVGGLSWLLVTEEGAQLLEFEELDSSGGSRQQIWSHTLEAIGDHLPFGSGLGTFSEVYQRYEDTDKVSKAYINHAHNDYLELLLELGFLSLPLMVAFLAWWMRSLVRIWLNETDNPFALAGAIAVGTILIHSVVDYPLRTAAISGVFAISLVMMAVQSAAIGKAPKQPDRAPDQA
ncbi:O-antigen ligase family protein [Porphyrobacter sp. SLTP]|uniref:O-antigen ligase family protein n=1 Tax=Porphyrobacter sp. SLTP TaxID=2683266 RepID=UPI002570CAF2|nr:O-antigen ligase family protein [Porphyrobacter sp. SLTP]